MSIKYTQGGTRLVSKTWAFWFGGTYLSKVGGYNWRPNAFRLAYRWWTEGWHVSLWDFIKVDDSCVDLNGKRL